MKSTRKTKSMLVSPTIMNTKYGELEYSIHSCPLLLRDDLQKVFPTIPDAKTAHVIPTMQRTRTSMTEFTQESENDKNELLNIFTDFAKEFANRITELGYWVDYTDPASGYPVLTQPGGRLYSDVDACEILLRYRIDTVGGTCRILSHPTWGTSVYPATIFTMAPLDIITNVINEIKQVNAINQ
jgi:hypothetical protein